MAELLQSVIEHPIPFSILPKSSIIIAKPCSIYNRCFFVLYRNKLLNLVRNLLEPWIKKLGFGVAAIGLSAHHWTLIGTVFAIFSAIAYSELLFGGAVVGGILLLSSGFIDIIDGAVARAKGTVSNKGGFLDSTYDRLGEVFIFTGIMLGGYAESWIVLLALSFSLLVSYAKSRSETFGLRMAGIGIGERAERILVLGILSIIGLVWLGVIIILLLTVVTFIHRVYYASKRLTS